MAYVNFPVGCPARGGGREDGAPVMQAGRRPRPEVWRGVAPAAPYGDALSNIGSPLPNQPAGCGPVPVSEARPAADGKRERGNYSLRRPLYRLTTGPRPTPGGRQPFGGPLTPSGGAELPGVRSKMGHPRQIGQLVSEQEMTDASRQTSSELARMTEREILQANNLRLRVIQREVHSIKRLLIGVSIAGIGLAAALVIFTWLA
jgi:hypothetical protein